MFLTWEAKGRTQVLDLDGRVLVTIGRSLDCDVVLEEEAVSRQHATIEASGDAHLLADSGSTNGTLLNGHKLTPGALTLLRAGDTILAAGLPLVYAREAPARSRPKDASCVARS